MSSSLCLRSAFSAASFSALASDSLCLASNSSPLACASLRLAVSLFLLISSSSPNHDSHLDCDYPYYDGRETRHRKRVEYSIDPFGPPRNRPYTDTKFVRWVM